MELISKYIEEEVYRSLYRSVQIHERGHFIGKYKGEWYVLYIGEHEASLSSIERYHVSYKQSTPILVDSDIYNFIKSFKMHKDYTEALSNVFLNRDNYIGVAQSISGQKDAITDGYYLYASNSYSRIYMVLVIRGCLYNLFRPDINTLIRMKYNYAFRDSLLVPLTDTPERDVLHSLLDVLKYKDYYGY